MTDKLPDPIPPTRTVHQMRVMDASGRMMVMQVSPETLKRMKAESESARKLTAMPWYSRWPTIAAKRLGYWIGRAIGKLVKRR